ncbi:hypothetical protein Ddye_016731 [Dipteronia dyeriana]|uniref:HMA domain-containing protein n=1 Tax=Dipteronia dyeriana TaxID=168575 RepID=A0AAD9U878_9ROSI|nr:hypothetical protein Ddye_016731 [Dipteronia dyeriana]
MDCNSVAAKTCVMKMQLKCESCQKKVKKVLQKIHGVHSINIDANEGTVAVSSTVVDPQLLIAMLAKAGQKAELLWESPQQIPLHNPNPQMKQPFKNVPMTPPHPPPPPPPPPASDLQASGFDHGQLQELARIPGLKHVELQHSRNMKLVFKDHNDDHDHYMQMKPMVYYGTSSPVLYYAHPFATPPNYYGYGGGGLQPTNLPHAQFNCCHDDDGNKCIVM